jgi:predicted nuclease with TOPRIM domain
MNRKVQQERGNLIQERDELHKQISVWQQKYSNLVQAHKDLAMQKDKALSHVEDLKKKLKDTEPFIEKAKRYDSLVNQHKKDLNELKIVTSKATNLEHENSQLNEQVERLKREY